MDKLGGKKDETIRKNDGRVIAFPKEGREATGREVRYTPWGGYGRAYMSRTATRARRKKKKKGIK